MTPVESGHVAPPRRTYPQPTGPDTIPVDIVPPAAAVPPEATVPDPQSSHDAAEVPAAEAAVADVAPTAALTDPKTEGRQALRVARRQRRRLMIGCAVVITICLALTVAIVVMASDRSPTTSAVAPAASAVAPAATATAHVLTQSRPISHAHHTDGATAPKGANR